MFLTPLPGTRLWDEMEAKNRVIMKRSRSDWRYFTLTYPVARYNHLSWSEMIEEKDESLKWLERAVEWGMINYPLLSDIDPIIENIRGEERFKKLMERVKYEWENFEV